MSLQNLEKARIWQLKHKRPWLDSVQVSFKPSINRKLAVQVMASIMQEFTVVEHVRSWILEPYPLLLRKAKSKKAKTGLITPFLLLREEQRYFFINGCLVWQHWKDCLKKEWCYNIHDGMLGQNSVAFIDLYIDPWSCVWTEWRQDYIP